MEYPNALGLKINERFSGENYEFANRNASSSVGIIAPVNESFEEILTPDALHFIAQLEREFRVRRKDILKNRSLRQRKIDEGEMPGFLKETKSIRRTEWKVSPVPQDLMDRRLEITGPVDRKMIINALNSETKVFMADFEDSCSPTWENILNGQINLRDAIHKTISYVHPQTEKVYTLNKQTATLMVRPRGWHLNEKHVILDGEPVSASLFDFGLFFFHNAKSLINNGSGPYFYLPKLENHLEARLWNDVFLKAQATLNIPKGTIKATVLIETILAAFEMDEILYELRDHSAGLNCGRWDYIFSFIKKFRNHSNYLLPDRSVVTMDRHFLKSYVTLLIQTCHKRGAHAMGGMAAQIPIKHDPEANREAMDKVRMDKEREMKAGHDGTWIAHPGLAPVALEAFRGMVNANQIDNHGEDITITVEDLLKVPSGEITEEGVRHNIRVGIQYVEAWIGGNGCVPLYHLMEDAATAEISRAQLWQWLHYGAESSNGNAQTLDRFNQWVSEELARVQKEVGTTRFESGHYQQAAEMFSMMVTQDKFDEFLTIPAYQYI